MDLLSLNRSNCKNCYKCIRHCPVKSIRFSGNQAHIIEDACIYCGQCFVVCPQNAKVIANGVEQAKVLLAGDQPVVASIAPSFIANYNGKGIKTMEKALMALGFDRVEETALGATMVKKQYEQLLAEKSQDVLITSCCHTINLLIQKHFPELISHLAPVITPMHAHCQSIKEQTPGAKTVFIGPCISKKHEAMQTDGAVDCVLTFEELTHWLEDEQIELTDVEEETEAGRARIFPTAGGIIKSMEWPADHFGYEVLSIDGLSHCIAALKDIQNGQLKNCFIEMSACPGSCIGGPVMEKYHHSPVRDYMQVSGYSGMDDFVIPTSDHAKLVHHYPFTPVHDKQPGEKDITRILKQMGKTKPEDELNCSSCGYNTCREKAVAVFQGKADISMCLPFLTDKAESFSDNIIRNTPNGIFVLNEDLEVQQINSSACHIFGLIRPEDAMGEHIVHFIDPAPFLDMQEGHQVLHEEKLFLTEQKKYVDMTLIFEKEYQIFICIMSDITQEVEQKKSREQTNRKTVETADEVIEKQMHIVQEIASLLGETTAETKVALTKLKESIENE